MIKKLLFNNKEQVGLACRLILSFVFISYGWGKLTGNQFGLSEVELAKPIKDLNLFRISWYVFDHQPFKSFIGVSQILGGLLLVINRTRFIGILMLFPIIINILVMDLTIMPKSFAHAFAWRFGFYLALVTLILWLEKEHVSLIFEKLVSASKTELKVKDYLFAPLIAFAIFLIFLLVKIVFDLILHPHQMINAWQYYYQELY